MLGVLGRKPIGIFLFLFLISFVLPHQTWAKENRKLVTIVVQVDLSSSMKSHISKLKDLANQVHQAMEQSQCDYRIAVSNIQYYDYINVNLTPWGEPTFVTKDIPTGPDIISDRILNPLAHFNSPMKDDGEEALPNGANEITYGSIVSSIDQNWNLLQDSDSLAYLLVTDAAPAFEELTPEQALAQIHTKLNGKPFLAAILGPLFSDPMPVYAKGHSCMPDFNGVYGDIYNPGGAHLDMEGWISKDINATHRFARLSQGAFWDVCDPSYEEHIQEFILMVMDQMSCQLMM